MATAIMQRGCGHYEPFGIDEEFDEFRNAVVTDPKGTPCFACAEGLPADPEWEDLAAANLAAMEADIAERVASGTAPRWLRDLMGRQ